MTGSFGLCPLSRNMASSAQTQKKTYFHPALKGLGEKDLVSLYNATSVTKMAPGDILAKEGASDEKLYLILEGTAQVKQRVNGLEKKLAVLGQGDVVLGASSQGGVRPATVVASEPMRAFVFDNKAFNALPPQIELAIYKNLNSLSQQQLQNVRSAQKEIRKRQKALSSAVLQLLKARSGQYENSEMIQGMLKNIPRLPMYANRLAVVILDENVSSRDVAELAKMDPSLVSVVLKTVNSAYYGFKRKISDFQHAVLLMGFNHVYQLVMDVGLKSTMPKTPEFSSFFL